MAAAVRRSALGGGEDGGHTEPPDKRLRLVTAADPVEGAGVAEVSPSPASVDNLDKAQELCRELIRAAYPELQRRAEGGEEGARDWLARFLDLGGLLGVQATAPGEASPGPDLSERAAALLRESLAQRRVPSATYRLQLTPGFTFHDPGAIVPYLHALGATDCYTSPLLQARAG